MEYTNNLNLRLPQGSCYWNLDTWKTNMNILDKAYLDIQHNIHANLVASNITCSNAKADGKLVSTNCQSMFEEMNHKLSRVRFITVTSDMTIPIATDAHDYLVLTFGDPVYDVTFVKSNPSSSNEFSYLNGSPNFQKNKSYELSFLRLCCLWKEKEGPAGLPFICSDTPLYIASSLVNTFANKLNTALGVDISNQSFIIFPTATMHHREYMILVFNTDTLTGNQIHIPNVYDGPVTREALEEYPLQDDQSYIDMSTSSTKYLIEADGSDWIVPSIGQGTTMPSLALSYNYFESEGIMWSIYCPCYCNKNFYVLDENDIPFLILKNTT